MTRADRVIRAATIASVATVGLAAAVLSYRHQFELAAGHGESALTAKLLPTSIDGLLLAGTLAVLDASRRQTGHAWAARITVGLGVAMTVWANVVHGIGFGWTGIIISGWPPVALIAAIEVLARMIRPSPAPAALAAGSGAPAHLIEAQQKFADKVAEHRVPTIRQIRSGLSVGAAKAAEAQRHLAVLAQSNGHG